MIRRPPRELPKDPYHQVLNSEFDNALAYLENYNQPIDSKGRYLPYHDIYYRAKERDLDPDLAWALVKQARNKQLRNILPPMETDRHCRFMLTPTIQKTLSLADRHTTYTSLEWMSSQIGEKEQLRYLLQDLIEDESISSSQLEGAATTTDVARRMLTTNSQPRTMDEKMILGNYKLMNAAWENRKQRMSPELIADLHQIGVEDIDDERYSPGVFRGSDDVVVEDSDGEVVHQPPPAKDLDKRLKKLCDWINTDHDNAESNRYIHPLVKAIAIHFALGYEHPFRDGNGRVARALFYWFMFKMGYAAFRYISISVLLKKAPAKYGKSYLYTEQDELDLTYFIEHQCSIITRAISRLSKAYRKALSEKQEFENWLYHSGLLSELNTNQRIVFQVAASGTQNDFVTRNVSHNLGCSYNTASNILNRLVDLGLFTKHKEGRVWHYRMKPKEEIRQKWS